MLTEQTRAKLEQIHRIKILGIDLDIIGIILFSYYLCIILKQDYIKIFLIILILSIIIHRIFRINTRINEKIFGKV